VLVEYIKLFKIGVQAEIFLDSLFPTALILLSVTAIVFIGYKIKEELGAIIAMLICGFIFFYMKDLL
jgi:hypothetical protein